MPQLDPNTFIYQYFGIIVLLLAIYTILSYIVLPILLRLMLVRNLFLTTRQTITDLGNTVSDTYKQMVSLRLPHRNFNLLNNLVFNSISLVGGWANFLNANLGFSHNQSNRTLTTSDKILFNEATTEYLILFLLTEIESNDTNDE